MVRTAFAIALAVSAAAQPKAPLQARITLAGPAYVHMPIWIEVQLPEPQSRTLQYPVTIAPDDFGGHQFEVRRNGALLDRSHSALPFPRSFSGPGSLGMIGCGSLMGLPHPPKAPARLPLHLQYRFDEPGSYEVRYTGYDCGGKGVLARSDWLRFEIGPHCDAEREAWLASLKQARPSDAVELLSEFLPSILAVPDRDALDALEDAVYDPSPLVRSYALYALHWFRGELLKQWIPELFERRGPTPDLACLLSWQNALFRAESERIARAVLKFAGATPPVLSAGALQSLIFLKAHYNWSKHPEMPAQFDAAVDRVAGKSIDTRNAMILQPLALYLGAWKSDRSREWLWRLVEDATVREQALICLGWIGDERDKKRTAQYR